MNDDEIDRRLRNWGEAGRRTAPEVHLPDFATDRTAGPVARITPWSRRARWRVPLIAAAGVIVVAVAASAGITRGFGIGGHTPATSPSSTSTPEPSPSSSGPGGCVPSGDGFSLSLAIDSGGQATPQQAAAYFGVHGGTPGYRAPADSWKRIPDPNHGVEPGVALRAGDVFVHVVTLSDGTWSVDSGGHCAASPATGQGDATGTAPTLSVQDPAFTAAITLPISNRLGIRSAAIVDGHLVVMAPEYLARISPDGHGHLSVDGQANVDPPIGDLTDADWELISDGRHLWAIAPNSGSYLYRIDPTTLQPGHSILVPESIVDVAAMDGHLYLNTDNGVYDVAPSTTVQVHHADVMTRGGRAMAADPSRHRLLLLQDDGGGWSIEAYSPSRDKVVATQSLTFHARTIVAADGAIWVTGTENTAGGPHPVLVSLDPATLQVLGHGPVEVSLTSVPTVLASGRNLWIRSTNDGDQLWCANARTAAVAQHWSALPGTVAAQGGRAFAAQGSVVGQLTLNSACAGR